MEYYIITFGCQMNVSDSERIASVLENANYKETSNINEANLIVVNMCSVRQSAVDRVHGLSQKFQKLLKKNPKLKTILTGCILKKDRKKFSQIFDYILSTSEAQSFVGLMQPRQLGLARSASGAASIKASEPQEASERVRKNLAPSDSVPSGYVPIMTGCNNFCSYCVVPYTRGREISRPAEEIISEIKNLVKNDCKEIWLIGQNVNSYSNVLKNNGIVNFPKLLKMINDLPGDFALNFLTSHPKDFSDELIETMKNCEKLSKRLNLPIQSGDDEILKKMNRPYTVAQYKNLVKKIRKAIPNISLSTDVIVGFPGETKKQFENTAKIFKEISFDVAFINKYSRRPGTAAEKMKDDVSWQEKKRREKILIDLVNK